MGSHKDPEYALVEKLIWSELDTREDAANAEASLHEVFDVAVSHTWFTLTKLNLIGLKAVKRGLVS